MIENKLKFKDHLDYSSKENWLAKEIKDCNHTYHIPGINTLTPMKFKNKNVIAVDIGANVGSFCCYASSCFDTIYAFEAAYNTYNIAKENTSHLNNIQLFHQAVAAKDNEVVKLYAPSSALSGDTSVFNINTSTNTSAEETKSISLEGICQEHDLKYIDYLKVDCEGSEYDFLMGKDLSKINYMVVEIHPGYMGIEKTNELRSHFDKYFALNYTIGEHILFYRAWPHHHA